MDHELLREMHQRITNLIIILIDVCVAYLPLLHLCSFVCRCESYRSPNVIPTASFLSRTSNYDLL